MPTPEALARKMALVRNRVRGAAVLYGSACVVAAAGGLSLAVLLLDRAFHFDSPNVRFALLLTIAAVGGGTAWRTLLAPLLFPVTDVELAAYIERRFPGFEERLASSFDFLESQTDPAVGSPELQRRVIEETVQRAKRLDFRQVIDLRAVLPAVYMAGCLVLIGAAMFLSAPRDAAFAVQRLARPYSAGAWPRRTNLQLLTADFQPVDPQTQSIFQVVRGRKLELLVEDANARLPDEVTLEYRFPNEAPVKEPLRHVSLRDRSGNVHDVCLLSLPADRGPVWFRARGGDDDTMRELEMRVMLPPAVESLKVRLVPPKYTARPPVELPAGDGRVRGVVGTEVVFQARSSKPLASVSLAVKEKPAGKTSLLPDHYSFRGSFLLAEPGTYGYGFRLVDLEGVENADRQQNEVVSHSDTVPDVMIDEPGIDTTVTAAAEIPVVVTAKDDFGLRQVRLRFNVGDSSEAHAATVVLASELARPDHHRATLSWRLKDLAISEGMRVSFWAEATDWYDLGPPHVGKSTLRTLTVVPGPQKEAEILARQGDLLRLLERAENSQSQAREQTRDLDVQLDRAGRMKTSDLDLLKRVQSDQRRINEALSNSADGAGVTVRRLLDELKQNRVASRGSQDRLERFDRELSELRDRHLPTIDDNLNRAVTGSELQGAQKHKNVAAGEAIKGALREQDVVLESLRNMLGDLSQWRDWQNVHEGLRDLAAGQQKLNQETADLSRTTLARPISDLNSQEQADLARLAEHQKQLADQIGQIESRLRQATKGNGSSSEKVAATLKAIEQSNVESRMREIGGNLSRNSVGQAMSEQEKLLDELKKLDESASQHPDLDLHSAVAKMAQAEESVDALRKRQEILQKRTQQLGGRAPNDAEPQLKELRKEQARLRESADRAARELRRLGTEGADEALRRAGAHMSQAQEELEHKSPAGASKEQQQALNQLDQAKSQLQKAKRQAASQLAQQSLVRIADRLSGLAKRQASILDETRRLDATRTQQNHWTRGQLRTLQLVARQQSELSSETADAGKSLAAVEVYAWALRNAAAQMQSAGERLSRQLTDTETAELEGTALSRLRDLVAALNPPKDSSQPQQQADEMSSTDQPQNAEGAFDTVSNRAQLVLLKTLQQDLLWQTNALDQSRAKLTSESTRAQTQRLALEQGELANLIQRIVERIREAPARGAAQGPSQGAGR